MSLPIFPFFKILKHTKNTINAKTVQSSSAFCWAIKFIVVNICHHIQYCQFSSKLASIYITELDFSTRLSEHRCLIFFFFLKGRPLINLLWKILLNSKAFNYLAHLLFSCFANNDMKHSVFFTSKLFFFLIRFYLNSIMFLQVPPGWGIFFNHLKPAGLPL